MPDIDDDLEGCMDISECMAPGDAGDPVTRGEVRLVATMLKRRVDRMSRKLDRVHTALFDPRNGLDSIRWWFCRGVATAGAIAAGMFGALEWLRHMGWL